MKSLLQTTISRIFSAIWKILELEVNNSFITKNPFYKYWNKFSRKIYMKFRTDTRVTLKNYREVSLMAGNFLVLIFWFKLFLILFISMWRFTLPSSSVRPYQSICLIPHTTYSVQRQLLANRSSTNEWLMSTYQYHIWNIKH